MEAALGESRFGGCEVDGVLMDLGLSGFQLEDKERGFSFSGGGRLDMRMGVGSGETAAAVLNGFSEVELEEILREYGEEPKARGISRSIVEFRGRERLERTEQLAAICEREWGAGRRRHAATLTFQALRIFINRELEELEEGLVAAAKLVRKGGRVGGDLFS